jgi:hypothetical protein
MPSTAPTDVELSKYPPGSILAEMLIDIYANPRGGVIILHDRPFVRQPRALELDVVHRELWFMADGARRPFGAPIKPALLPQLARARSVTFFHFTRDPEAPQHAELIAELERFFGSVPLNRDVRLLASFAVPLHVHGPGSGRFRRGARGLARGLRAVTRSIWIWAFPEL